MAPVLRLGKIMAISLNYADHIAENGAEMPPHQVWFSKAVTAVNGPFDPIQLPQVAPHSDYEAEMVAVTGTGGRHLSREAAPGAVFGWCVGNDITERAWQHRTPPWILGKSFDSHAPFGPWITTADEVPDPYAFGIRGLVNGELRQSSNTSHLAFNAWSQVEHLSQAMMLEPGDLLFTGTPGDRVRIEIGGLGAIENVCEPET